MRLNIGCGSKILEGYTNLDVVKQAGVDIVHDLDTPWPFPDNSVEEIEAKDIFEHVNNPILFMTEAHRVLEDYGTLHIRTPHYYYGREMAFTDPTHKRFPTEHTWNFWIPGNDLYDASNKSYGNVAYKKVHILKDNGNLDVLLRKINANI